MSTLFLDAAWGTSTPTAPVWLMRQAGRYLPEYRDLKQRYGFWTMVRQPDLAAEITLHPVRRFPLDAAILFSDIMTPLPSMGVHIEFQPGPVISQPIRSQSDVDGLTVPEAEEIAPFVAEACTLLRTECPVPLIGFAGAPLTLMTYLVQGTGTNDHGALRGWLWGESAIAHALLDKLTEVTIRYLRTQILSGAQAVQLFDSWAGVFDEEGYANFGLPYAHRILDALGELGVPRIYLAVGASHLYPRIATLPAEVISVDWRCSLAYSREQLPGKVLQGNLDPGWLLSTPELAVSAATTVLRSGMGGAHIFNLGHGVLPQTPPDTVARLVNAVHEFRRDVTEGGAEQ